MSDPTAGFKPWPVHLALGNYRAWVVESHIFDCHEMLTCEDCDFESRAFESASLILDLAVAAAHPTPRALTDEQQRVWIARLDANLVRSVAW